MNLPVVNLSNPPRQIIALAIVCSAMVMCGAWAWGYLDDQQTAAAAASRELADCRELGRQISAGRSSGAAAPRPGDLTSAIAAAATNAGMTDGSLDHLDPGSVRRNPDGTSSQRQIDLSIRQATLRQIITFAHALSAEPLSLHLDRLRLTPSEAESGGWAAQMTLTNPVSDDLNE